MNRANDPTPVSDKDRLVTRPADPLPTVLNPSGPESRGYPADPKPGPEETPGNPGCTDPEGRDLGRTA